VRLPHSALRHPLACMISEVDKLAVRYG
jgi:hypothetical protein